MLARFDADELCFELISDYIDLSTVSLPEVELAADTTPDVVAATAAAAREQWQIGAGPVPLVVQLVESRGVVVLRLAEGTDARVDALSTTSETTR